MSHPTKMADVVVPGEEVERRIAEYRRLGFQRRAEPQVVYQPPHQQCPWPGCGSRIRGIKFQLESLNDPVRFSQWLAAWWQGPGLVGRCPGCGHYVLFEITGKKAVQDPTAMGSALLPDDWHQWAYLV